MKKTIALLTLLISILTTTYSYSQDKILYKTGEEIEVKITEVGVDYVKYKKVNFLNGPDFKISQSTLFMITFENGEKMIINQSSIKSKIETITLQQGSKIMVSMLDAISSDKKNGRKVSVGEVIDLEVNEDFIDSKGNVLIITGTPVIGTVIVAEKRKALGKKGELAFRVDNIRAVDGTNIPVRLIFNSQGKDKSAVAIVAGAIIAAPLLLIKGKPAFVESGTVFPAIVKRNIEISIGED